MPARALSIITLDAKFRGVSGDMPDGLGGRPGSSSSVRPYAVTPRRQDASRRVGCAMRHATWRLLVIAGQVGVQPGQPGGEPVDGRLELRVEVNEVAQPPGEPGHGDFLIAPPVVKLLDTRVGEVHELSLLPGWPS